MSDFIIEIGIGNAFQAKYYKKEDEMKVVKEIKVEPKKEARARSQFSRLTPADAANLPDGDYQVKGLRLADLTEDNFREVGKDAKTTAILRDSIAREGVLQPVQVSLIMDSGKPSFLLADGHHRKSILEALGKEDVPAVVTIRKEANRKEHDIRAVMTNLARNELRPFEVVLAYKRLIDAGVNSDELAELVRVDPAYVRKVLRVAELPADTLSQVRSNPKDYPMRKLIQLTQAGTKTKKPMKKITTVTKSESEARLKTAGYKGEDLSKILATLFR